MWQLLTSLDLMGGEYKTALNSKVNSDIKVCS